MDVEIEKGVFVQIPDSERTVCECWTRSCNGLT